VAEIGGFASAAVLALTIDVLGRIDPALLPNNARAPDYLADAAVSAQQKSAVLQHAMTEGGAGPLLCVGGDCARLATQPIFESLLRSTDPGKPDGLRHDVGTVGAVRRKTAKL
jgi:hypothetical protein